MTLRNPNANESVEDYDKLQTVEINANATKINANTTKIGSDTLVGSILYRLGIIKDYVIESGSNANGNYEKWASGKLVQWGRITQNATMNVADGSLFRTNANITKNLPISHVGEYEILFGLRSYTLAGVYTNYQQPSYFTIYPRSTTSTGSVSISISFETIGRWKA